VTGMQDDFTELLRNNGLKVTKQRIAILEAMESKPGEHLTAEEIFDYVKPRYKEIGLATVYRTIQLYAELGLVDRLNLDDGYTRYEIGQSMNTLSDQHHHHHLICSECGQVAAFQGDLLETLEQRILESIGFLVEDHEVKLYGICKECREKRCKDENY